MSKRFTVEEYGITRRDGGRWDDQSARDVSEFDNLDEARKAFGAVDVRRPVAHRKAVVEHRLMRAKSWPSSCA